MGTRDTLGTWRTLRSSTGTWRALGGAGVLGDTVETGGILGPRLGWGQGHPGDTDDLEDHEEHHGHVESPGWWHKSPRGHEGTEGALGGHGETRAGGAVGTWGPGGLPLRPPPTFQAELVELGGHVGDDALGVTVALALQPPQQVGHHGGHRLRVALGRPRAQQQPPQQPPQPLPLVTLPAAAGTRVTRGPTAGTRGPMGTRVGTGTQVGTGKQGMRWDTGTHLGTRVGMGTQGTGGDTGTHVDVGDAQGRGWGRRLGQGHGGDVGEAQG